MKNKLWMGVVLAIAFCASCGLSAFAEKAATNCIGDESGMTNCGSSEQTDCIGEEGKDCVAATEEEAQPPILVDKTTLEFGRIMETGRRYSKSLTIKNTTDKKMVVRVEAVSYNSDASTEEQKDDVADWVAFGGGKRKYELKAGGKVQLSVRLMVPADVKGGTYYAKIKITNGTEAEDQYVIVRADVALDGYKYGGQISAQDISFFNLGDRVTASAHLKNNGTAGFTAHYTVRYKNAFGLPNWQTLVEEEREILPGTEEAFGIDENKTSAVGFGVFTVEQKVSYINSENRQVEAIMSHAVVNLPWWALVVAGGVLLLIIVLVIVVKVRRKKAKEAKLIEKKVEKAKKKGVSIEV